MKVSRTAATPPSGSNHARPSTAAPLSICGPTSSRTGTTATASISCAPATGRWTARLVLVVDHYVPTPDKDAGSRSMMACLHILLAGRVRGEILAAQHELQPRIHRTTAAPRDRGLPRPRPGPFRHLDKDRRPGIRYRSGQPPRRRRGCHPPHPTPLPRSDYLLRSRSAFPPDDASRAS